MVVWGLFLRHLVLRAASPLLWFWEAWQAELDWRILLACQKLAFDCLAFWNLDPAACVSLEHLVDLDWKSFVLLSPLAQNTLLHLCLDY